MTLPLLLLLMTTTAPQPAPAPDDWRDQANARIERIRKGDFALRLTDADGKPFAGEVRVEQIGHHFRFGTAITGDPDSDSPYETKYRQFIREYFNTLVCENHMKWYAIEKEKDKVTFERADAYMKFAEENDMVMRGHCLFWSKEKFVKVQDWLLETSDDELRKAMEDHITATVTRYKGRLWCWDVNNEMLDGNWYAKRLGEDIRTWMFKRARELDPDVGLFVNEYSILGSPGKTKRYIELIRKLKADGADVTGIGIQEHACERIVTEPIADDKPERANWRLTPHEFWQSLDTLKKEVNLPVHLTEISSKHKDETKRADALEALFRLGFAHESVEAILVWGFVENRHWLGKDAAIVDKNFNLLEPGKRLHKLLKEEWLTSTTAKANAGKLTFRGFYGTYKLTANGKSATVKLSPDQITAEARLE